MILEARAHQEGAIGVIEGQIGHRVGAEHGARAAQLARAAGHVLPDGGHDDGDRAARDLVAQPPLLQRQLGAQGRDGALQLVDAAAGGSGAGAGAEFSPGLAELGLQARDAGPGRGEVVAEAHCGKDIVWFDAE